MGQHRYNHTRKIVDKQPAKAKWIMPGSIVSFNYSGTDIFDRKPMILVLWNDLNAEKLHGINLNYLNEMKVKELFERIVTKGENRVILEDQMNPNDTDDNLPSRNLIHDPYTRFRLPTYREDRGGNPLSKSEAIRQMDILYKKVLKRIVTKHDIYRSYHVVKATSIKIVTYDLGGLFR